MKYPKHQPGHQRLQEETTKEKHQTLTFRVWWKQLMLEVFTQNSTQMIIKITVD